MADESEPQIDEAAVMQMFERVPTLLTSAELAKLQACVRQAAELNCKVVEISNEAARRVGSDKQTELNTCEAIQRWYAVQAVYGTLDLAQQEFTIN